MWVNAAVNVCCIRRCVGAGHWSGMSGQLDLPVCCTRLGPRVASALRALTNKDKPGRG
jgi:hypothetical protein